MGVDINTYRCRVGKFRPRHSAGVLMMPLNIDVSVLIKMLGSVSFVRMLLLIAGIEQNPGPADIQQDLIAFYKRHFKILPALPLFGNAVEDNFLTYKSPTIRTKRDSKLIKCYGDIFYWENKSWKEIYMIGDAGVGKTSFCMHLCLMWCLAKCGTKLDEEYEYVSKFDYVFYISLRDTEHYHVVDMIKECYFEQQDPVTIQDVLRKNSCLVIFDGLDEWNPYMDGKMIHKLPKRLFSENCINLTTSRQSRINSFQLSGKDHQIHISGIHGDSLTSYIENILNYLNKQNSTERLLSDFESDIRKYGLTDEIAIPMITSHIVVLWYENRLADMPRTLIYANILEVLFQRASQNEVTFPPSTESTLQLPDSLSGLKYVNKYVMLLYNVCHLSFCSLFKQDETETKLVFCRDQLQSEPYYFPCEEIDFLCKIGLLSTNEIFGSCSVEKVKIYFVHKCYLEFFAAFFVSSFDSNNSFTDVAKRWKCVNDIVQFENFCLLLAGFSFNDVKLLFENIYLTLSDDLTSCRRNALFHHSSCFYSNQIRSLCNIVVSCFKEVNRSNKCGDKAFKLRMEDFVFTENSNDDILRQLLLLNTTSVISLHCVRSKYFDEFDLIKNLQCINIDTVSSADYLKFTQSILSNESTLHTVCIAGDYNYPPLIPELAVRSLHHLTSLSLSRVKMQHDSLDNLVKFLSNNILIENIRLSAVTCGSDLHDDFDHTFTLDLSKHTKLSTLCLHNVNILCKTVNSSNLQAVSLLPFSRNIVSCYIDVYNCIKDSQLEHLDVNGFRGYISDTSTLKTLISTVRALPCVKSLKLSYLVFPYDILLQPHPDVTQMKILLQGIIMSHQCFHCFIESFVNNKSEINVHLGLCKIILVDGENHSELSVEESINHIIEYLESISAINITYRRARWLRFETTKFQ